MCGIAGSVRWEGMADRDARVEQTAAMVEAVAHRGPDDQRTVQNGAAVLGAARLAIRGLQDGAQPMVHEGSGVVVVCNGEIDNHRELKAFLAAHGHTVRTTNDVAVLADLYGLLGAECVERLRVRSRSRSGTRSPEPPRCSHATAPGSARSSTPRTRTVSRFASEIASLVTAVAPAVADGRAGHP